MKKLAKKTTRLLTILMCAVGMQTLAPTTAWAQDEVNPNFHIYLCFGQSNMEGNAAIESQDKQNVPTRFKMMAAVDMTSPARKMGHWYRAIPPLCREGTGLTPVDYFGRTMVENLPEDVTVGVINVAVGGCTIELFDEDKCEGILSAPDCADWFKNYCSAYDNNPFRRLVNMAKEAQKTGVIKGILLHQGCSNNGQQDWPLKVKRVYIRLLNELGLNEEDVPLLVGETLYQDQGGVCWGHNAIIANIGTVIPNAHIISAEGCPGSDIYHFTAEGYRMIGKRYAETMLTLLDKKAEIDFDTSEAYFPLTKAAFNPSLYLQGKATVAAGRLNVMTANGGFGGWRYSKGADLSSARYLVVKLTTAATSLSPVLKIFDKDDYLADGYSYTIGKNRDIVIDLQAMYDANGNKVDPSHIYMVGFTTNGTGYLKISDAFLSNDGTTPIAKEPVDEQVSIDVNGVTRTYGLYVPANVQKNAPLVMSLHGVGGHSTDKQPLSSEVADSRGCIVVYPQGESLSFFGSMYPGWRSTGETSTDIDFLKAVIEDVAAKYSIDRKRIYCCGFSNGGMMTYTVANVASDVFAAYASISGFPLNEFHLRHTGARPVPFLHIHGKNDDFVKYSLVPTIVYDMVARNGSLPVPETGSVTGSYDKSVFPAGEGGFPFVYYEVDNMGHEPFTTYTEEGSSVLTMWNFMSQYSLDSPCDTTLKWHPYVQLDGWTPKQHGWLINSGSYLLLFGREQSTDANQNVYPSLQFDNGKYKLCIRAEGDADKTYTVKLQKLTGKRTVVMNREVRVGEDVTLLFEITDGWGEYKLTVTRSASTDNISIKELAVYTATEEELTSIASYPSSSAIDKGIPQYYTPSGIPVARPVKGVNLVVDKQGGTRKVLY
jgi:predicted esterase